jgi:hypothetical protein
MVQDFICERWHCETDVGLEAIVSIVDEVAARDNLSVETSKDLVEQRRMSTAWGFLLERIDCC